MSDRRYDDDEVAEIFAKAAEGPQSPSPQSPRDEGMTLAELKEIGREAGIAPEAVESAARSLAVRPQRGSRTLFGLPIGVERSILLDRRLTEEEWEHLVVELREVFQARGVVSANGSFRQWTNGNLQALLEPTAKGQRLRISTVKGGARGMVLGGALMIGVSAVMAIVALVAGHYGSVAPSVAIYAAGGAVLLGSGTIRLPAWARERARQMEEITSRLALETGADDAGRAGGT